MIRHRSLPLLALTLMLSLAACSDEPADDAATPAAAATSSATGSTTPAAAVPEEQVSANTLTLEGLGALKLGQPVDPASGFAARGAQASDACIVMSSPAYPDVYAIVEGGVVKRISVSEGSTVTLIEGVGPGATEATVDGAFPGFREEPHHYVPNGKYLTAPGAESGAPAVRFELDEGGKVTTVHVGMMPVLGYVEGCA
ncbi:MAG: hypothetical protein ABIT10_12525 [Alteraurantiacibacter sp.]